MTDFNDLFAGMLAQYPDAKFVEVSVVDGQYVRHLWYVMRGKFVRKVLDEVDRDRELAT